MLVELTGASRDDEVLDGLRNLVAHHVLVPIDTGYRFRHALLQEAVYDELLPGERTRLHTAIAESLEDGAATETMPPCWPSWPTTGRPPIGRSAPSRRRCAPA